MSASGLRPYPAYRDSGFPWLGKVPEHWNVLPAKRALRPESSGGAIIKNTASKVPKGDYVPAFSASGQDIWLRSPSHHGDALVLSAVGARCGKTFQASGDWGVVANTHVLRPQTNQNREFWWYVTNTQDWWERAGAAQPFVRVRATLDRPWTYPPDSEEQTAIARYLDDADCRIRRYIRAKERLIELLEERKLALIHEAVTGRIDVRTGQPYPAYKDSGIEWLGNVPEHWEVRRIKSLSLVKRGASPRPIADAKYFEEDGEYAWVRISDVTASERYLENTTQRLSRLGQSLSVELQPGSLFLSIAGSVGKPIITKIKCCIHDGFVYFPHLKEDQEFLFRVFSCNAPFGRLGKFGTQLNLNTDTVGNIHLGWPPPSERRRIVSSLDNRTKTAEQLMSSVRREIRLAREYHTRLIADVVTGKLDARGAAADLPETDPPARSRDRAEVIPTESNPQPAEHDMAKEASA